MGNPVLHYGKFGNQYFPVGDYKAGRHKRSSSKAKASISGKCFTGISYKKITGKSGNRYGSDILFLTEPLLPDPTPTPPNTPRLARSRPKRTEVDRIGHFGSSLGVGDKSETGRIRFREYGFKHRTQWEFSGLTEFWGASSVSSFQPFICVPKRTHRVFRRTHRVCPRTQ